MLPLLLKVIANSVVFACTPIAVSDGDGPIWCAEGPKIRLHGIAAREVKHVRGDVVDAGCKRGHPCSAVSGVVARDRLVSLLDGPRGTLRTGHVRVRAATLAAGPSALERATARPPPACCPASVSCHAGRCGPGSS